MPNPAPGHHSKDSPSVWSQIRTIILVTFLAILVWLLAESRMVQTRSVELQIVLLGNNQDPAQEFIVRPASFGRWESSIQVDLEGSLASLDQASRELRGRMQLVVGDHIPARPGVHDLDIRSLLRHNQALVSHGVTIRAISTEIARVEVDEVVSISLPVIVDVPMGVVLDGPPRAIPQTVSVRGPATLITGLEGHDLHASPSAESTAPMTPGRLETIPGVTIEIPRSIPEPAANGWALMIDPPQVDVRMTIRTLTQTTTLDRLPIQVLMAPGEAGRWLIMLNSGSEDIIDIHLNGPSEALKAIREGTVLLQAVLPLSYQELEQSITSKQVQIHGLPSDVEVTSDLPEIGFTVTPVKPADTPTQNTP